MDELFFNPDGTIVPVVQTNYAVEPAGPATPEDPRAQSYSVSGQRLGGDAYLEGNAVVIAKEGDFIQFKKINGYDGGRCQLKFFALRDGKPCSFQLFVNDREYGGINVMPTGGYYYDESKFTVPLNSGRVNNVAIKYLDGDFKLNALRVEPLD